jgi:uncharacterized membrane protein (UPF0127 family)
MRKFRNISILGIVVIVITFLFSTLIYFNLQKFGTCKNIEVKFDEKEITLRNENNHRNLKVLVADNYCERQQGLMNQHELIDYDGMLFIHEKPEILNYWMKNTYLKLDIAFYDESGRFLNVYENVPTCESKECISYKSLNKAKYSLETKAEIDLSEFYVTEGKLVY